MSYNLILYIYFARKIFPYFNCSNYYIFCLENCSSYDYWEFFHIEPCVLLTHMGSSCILTAPALYSVLFQRVLISFIAQCCLETEIWALGMLMSNRVSVLLGLLRRQSLEINKQAKFINNIYICICTYIY